MDQYGKCFYLRLQQIKPDRMKQITDRIEQAIELKKALLSNEKILNDIKRAIDELVSCYQKGGKTLFCGNGGSAADAQHLAAELAGKFYIDRPPIQAEACHVNSSFITAYSNDYNFKVAYARYISGVGRAGDILIAISTSGNSENVVNAAKEAKKIGMKVIALTGKLGGQLKSVCDILIPIPSVDTPRIQEAHIFVGHIICEQVEKALFDKHQKS